MLLGDTAGSNEEGERKRAYRDNAGSRNHSKHSSLDVLLLSPF